LNNNVDKAKRERIQQIASDRFTISPYHPSYQRHRRVTSSHRLHLFGEVFQHELFDEVHRLQFGVHLQCVGRPHDGRVVGLRYVRSRVRPRKPVVRMQCQPVGRYYASHATTFAQRGIQRHKETAQVFDGRATIWSQ